MLFKIILFSFYMGLFFFIKVLPFLLIGLVMWMFLGDGAKIFTKKQRAKSIHLSKKWTMSLTSLWLSMMFQFITLVVIINLTELSFGVLLQKAGLDTDDMTMLGLTMATVNFTLLLIFIIIKVRRQTPHIYKNLKVSEKKYRLVHQTEKRYVCFNKDEITIYNKKHYNLHELDVKHIDLEEIKSVETYNLSDITSIEFNEAGKYSKGSFVLDIGWAIPLSFNKQQQDEIYKLFNFVKDNYTINAHEENALYWIQTQ